MYTNFELNSNGVKLYGHHWAPENANRVVVLIHGIGEHAGRYNRMAEYFAHDGIALVSMDLRGHGHTAGGRGHAAPRKDMLSDIDALIEYARAAYPGLPLILYGHSMGGNLVLDYRRRGGLSAVPDAYIISAPWVKLVNDFPKPVVGFIRGASKLFPQFRVSSSCDEGVLGNPDTVRPYHDDPLVHGSITLLCAAECYTIGEQLFAGTLHGSDAEGAADAGTKKPTLLMHGNADRICDVAGSRKIAELEPEITYVEWDGYFHEIHNGNKTETGEKAILRAIEFINEV